ncbi:MAG: protein kinase, partial [Verrucomicrobia bacterium]|nr:protein kinase [Verrucomicrobiota bacterium]
MKPPDLSARSDPLVEFQRRHRTGLLTLLFTDIVGSGKIKQALGDGAGVALIQQHEQIVRELLGRFPDAQVIETAGDSFFILFVRPSDAVVFALRLQTALRALAKDHANPVLDRIGIHIGEVIVQEGDGASKRLAGAQVDACARIMSLADADQILLSRAAFDNARQVLKGNEIEGLNELTWLNHGPYLLKGMEESIEICEVGESSLACLKAPAGSEKAQRQVRADEEPVLGWRPALGQVVPNTKWVLEKKLGEGGFGEVWLGRHQTMKERRVFKFCFRADRVRSLKREMTLFRLLKERIGDHPNIVALRDVYFDEPPFYVVMDHVEGQDLKEWCEQEGGVEKVPLATRLEIVAQIADALQAARDAGVIHRDVKPGNILVAGNRQEAIGDRREWPDKAPPSDPIAHRLSPIAFAAKLTDFGIGQVVSEEALKGMTKAGFTETMISDSSSSQTGSQMYMAPELLAGKPASTRSDIYSLGVVLYQMLVGDLTRPLTTDWRNQITDALLCHDLEHCFAGNPQERFEAAGQLAKNLRSLAARRAEMERQQAELAARERFAYRRGVIRAAAVAVIIVAAVMALAIFAFQQARRA